MDYKEAQEKCYELNKGKTLKEISNNLENIIGEDTLKDIKKAAKDNKLDSSKYYSLAEKLKLLSNLHLAMAKIIDFTNKSF